MAGKRYIERYQYPAEMIRKSNNEQLPQRAADDSPRSVSELTRAIRESLETGFSDLAVQGELSNSHLHTSGHFYFTLKDAGAQISGVMWRRRVAGLAFQPQDGMQVIVQGRLTVYEPRGIYQIDAWGIRPLGVGQLQLAFERLKEKLQAEGLFDMARKRPLPVIPRRIGIVTSTTGAALHDMLTVINRRFPAVDVVVRHAQVQGVGAAEDIAGGIEDLNALGGIDVLIVGRGGGSLEDLWAFNEEVVARALFRSKIPTVSAVGHEVDVTIADFVADLRAPTPSAAGELVVPDKTALVDQVMNSWYTIQQNMDATIRERMTQLSGILKSYAFSRPADIVSRYVQRLDELQSNIAMTASHRLSLTSAQHFAAHQRLLALDPRLPLKRGYALVRRGDTIVSSARALATDDEVDIEFRDGIVQSRIE